MKAVHFGAGNIGRGFIGLLLSESGYDVFFITRSKKKIALLQQRHHYRVTLAETGALPFIVRDVTAASIDSIADVAEAVSQADLVTTAVGVTALKSIAKPIAAGVTRRLRDNPRPLNIIACENTIGGSSQLKKWVYAHLPEAVRRTADGLIAFPNAVVDRIVPAQSHSDILAVTVEPFWEWVIDRSQVIGPPPPIQGVQYVDSLKPFIERKLFTLNTGHCAAAYFGYLEGLWTIHEVMQTPALRSRVEAVVEETGTMLTRTHQWDPAAHHRYIQKILLRLANPQLRDSVVRVGRSPTRKLGPNDRLVRPAVLAHNFGIATPHLVSLIAAAMRFDYEDDDQAVLLQAKIRQMGVHAVITETAGLGPDHPLHHQIADAYQVLERTYPRPMYSGSGA